MNESVNYREYTKEERALIARTVAQGATADDIEIFLHICARTGLDPIARQIHLVKRGNRSMVQTGIDGYRLIADRTGKYAGSDDYRFDEGVDVYHHQKSERGNPVTATVTVYKMVNDIRCSFTATVRWEEYYPGKHQGFMWDKMPYLMLGKTAEALALRKAFPAELSGLYTDEEMQQVDVEPVREESISESSDDRTTITPPKKESNRRENGKEATEPKASNNQDRQGPTGSQPKGPKGEQVAGANMITKPARERIIEVARANGWADDEVRYLLSQQYGAASTKEVLRRDYMSIMNDLKNESARGRIRALYAGDERAAASA